MQRREQHVLFHGARIGLNALQDARMKGMQKIAVAQKKADRFRASPENPATTGEVLSMYTTNLAAAGVIPPQVVVGGRLADVIYFGPAPGYAGYYQVNFQVPDGIAMGPSVSVRLTYLGRSSNPVTIGVQ